MRRAKRQTCKRGHDLTDPNNIYVHATTGYTNCRPCERLMKNERMRKKRIGGEAPDPHPPVPARPHVSPETSNAWVRVLESPPGVRIETLEQFLEYYQVDTETWEVEKHVLNRYPVTVKDADGEPVVLHSFQVKAWLRLRKGKETLDEIKAAILADIRTAGSTYRPFPRLKHDPDVLLEIAPVDSHLGALAWSDETGEENYDLAIAARRYREAVEALLVRAARDKPAAILLRVGDDYLHVDSDRNTTTGGTPQDVDSRYKKVFRVGVSCAAWAARRCAELAPTKVVIVPGNHDSQSTFAIGEVLTALFADHPDITVSPAITPRQYVEWGTVMLCLSHGHLENPAAIPLLMATEAPAIWARTTHREAHLGHLHRRRKMNEDEFNGVRVRWLPTFKSADKWHAEKGFTNATRATEAYLWSKARGYLGSISEPIRAA